MSETDNQEAARQQQVPHERVVSNPIKSAAQIAIHHRRLMDAMTKQGPSEIAAAMDNLEGAIEKARSDLGLGG